MLLIGALATLTLTAPTLAAPATQEPITLALATGQPALFESALARYMEDNPDIIVEIIPVPGSSTDQLVRYQQGLRAHSPRIDVYDIEATWPVLLAPHLVDLSAFIEPEIVDGHFPVIVDANTVDERLVALPYHIDAGVLYYRTDLLEAYGYPAEPPATWDALTEMAQTIQAGERDADPYFWAYVWQGERYEGLTCNALEWRGRLLDADGPPYVDTPGALAALERAVGWVGTISPPAVTTYTEEETRILWTAGETVFMRNWTYLIRAAPDFPFGVGPLPEGGCLRGRGLAVSRYSENVETAAALAVYLTGPDAQRLRAAESTANPTLIELYYDPGRSSAHQTEPYLEDILAGAAARPVIVAGPAYDRLSEAYFTAVHRALTGEIDPATALFDLERELTEILPAPANTPIPEATSAP